MAVLTGEAEMWWTVLPVMVGVLPVAGGGERTGGSGAHTALSGESQGVSASRHRAAGDCSAGSLMTGGLLVQPLHVVGEPLPVVL